MPISAQEKKKRTAGVISFLLPGLGQVYSGHYFRGLTLFAAFALLANISEARLLLPLLALLAAAEAHRSFGKPKHPWGPEAPQWLAPLLTDRPTLSPQMRLVAFSAIGILGFVAWFALVTPWFFPFSTQMEVNSNVEQLADGVRNFQASRGSWPTDLNEVQAPIHKDPWGTDYKIRPLEEGFEIRSWGRDRQPSTRDDLAYRFRH